MRFLKAAALAVAVLVLAVVGFVGFAPGAWKDAVSDALSGLNPFHEETVDRTGPSVLVSLTDLNEFHAASGHYETVVDIEEDSKLPSFVKGERVLYVGKGNVDAVVDFSGLDEERIEISPDEQTVTVRLPAPTADKPELDLEESYVVEHDSGLADKFGGSDLEREAQLKAVDQMTEAATAGDALIELARTNTEAMLRGLLRALGHPTVIVIWDDQPAPESTATPTPQ